MHHYHKHIVIFGPLSDFYFTLDDKPVDFFVELLHPP